MSMRVFITHNPEDLDAYYGRALPEMRRIAQVVTNPTGHELTTAELIEAAVGCDVIVAHRSTAGPAEVFAALPGLVAFLRCAVDISTIDVEAASVHGVVVGRADKSFIASTAELALGLLLDLTRHIADSTLDYRHGHSPAQRQGRQLRGQTAGVIGFGAIGSYLADLLHAVGMEVLVCDPNVGVSDDRYRYVAFDELLSSSDVVFPLAVSTPETLGLIDARAIGMMRRGALLVNVSRGELLDERAVADALDAGHLGGLAIDVGQAPDQRPSPWLAARPGVVATPHLGGLTPENADAQAMSSVEQVAAMLTGEPPPRAVNPEAASRLRTRWTTTSV